jgi:hypothetical protein
MLHQVFGHETTTKYLFGEGVAKHGVKKYISLQNLNATSYDLRQDYFLDMAGESYDPKGGLSFTNFLKNKLRDHAELLHLGHYFPKTKRSPCLFEQS